MKFKDQDLKTGSPIEINPLPSNCVIYFPTDTESQWQTLNIKVVRNPMDATLRIENSTQQTIQLRVIDLLGRVMLETENSDYYQE